MSASLCVCQVNEEDLKEQHRRMADMLKHDGTKRRLTITNKNADKLLKKHYMLVVLFWVDNDVTTEKISKADISLLETVAQAFQKKNLAAATCEIRENQEFAAKSGVKYTGMIKIYHHGKVVDYFGQRSPDVMIPFVSTMLSAPLTVIISKTEKKTFDSVDLPKVLAYVKKDSKEAHTLAAAARGFQPMIQFHVIYEAKVAKQFHIKKINSLQFIKPFEKPLLYSSKKPFTEKEISLFIEQNKKLRIKKMRLENLHDVWAVDLTGYMVPIFAIAKHEEGNRFLATAKSVAKKFEHNANLSFVWIDPEPFPSMREYWQEAFGIDPSIPTIGAVDIHGQKSAWFTKDEGQPTVKEIIAWVNQLVSGEIKMAPMKRPKTKEQKRGETGDEDADEEESGAEKDEL